MKETGGDLKMDFLDLYYKIRLGDDRTLFHKEIDNV